jgi:hypothetical protein
MHACAPSLLPFVLLLVVFVPEIVVNLAASTAVKCAEKHKVAKHRATAQARCERVLAMVGSAAICLITCRVQLKWLHPSLTAYALLTMGPLACLFPRSCTARQSARVWNLLVATVNYNSGREWLLIAATRKHICQLCIEDTKLACSHCPGTHLSRVLRCCIIKKRIRWRSSHVELQPGNQLQLPCKLDKAKQSMCGTSLHVLPALLGTIWHRTSLDHIMHQPPQPPANWPMASSKHAPACRHTPTVLLLNNSKPSSTSDSAAQSLLQQPSTLQPPKPVGAQHWAPIPGRQIGVKHTLEAMETSA